MPRQKTGRPLGRPPVYHDPAERPVTISLRIPPDLAAQMKRYAHVQWQSVTELLLDGLRWRLTEGDLRGLGHALPEPSAKTPCCAPVAHGSAESPSTPLAELRAILARQEQHLQAVARAVANLPPATTPDSPPTPQEQQSPTRRKGTP